MPIHEQEEAFVKSFISANKQERYLQFLAKPKTRTKFLRDMSHSLTFKAAFVTELSPRERTVALVEQRLRMLGSETQVYVISPYGRLDQQWLPLSAVLTDILANGSEAIVCCLSGQLAFVQTEDGAYILHIQPDKPAI